MNKSNNNKAAPAKKPAAPASKQGRPRPPRGAGKAPQAFRPGNQRDGAQPQVAVASAYASGQRSAAPRMIASRDQVRIIHRELVGSVTGSVAFAISQAIALNPGLAASFPWLATQAQAWERYRFNRLRFCYYTRTGSNVPGSVLMVPDYDAADAAPSSEQIASSYEDTEEDAPWKDIECDLRPAALHALGPTKFVRTGSLSANQDIKTYDAGNFFLATLDGTAVPWGKLWVEYDVTLMTPQLNPAGGGVLAAQHITSSAPSSADLLASPATGANSTNIVSVASEVLTFNQAGKYLLRYFVQGTTCTQTAAPVAAAGAVLALSGVSGSGTASMTQSMLLTAVVGSTITFDNTLVAGTNADLIIAQVPAALG